MQPTLLRPDQIPDPWLFDSNALLAELDRIRDLAMQIPPTFNAQIGPINTVINAIWDLRERLDFLIRLDATRQSATQAAFRDAATAVKPSSQRQSKRIDRQVEARPANARRKA
jgi:hypothetical protein